MSSKVIGCFACAYAAEEQRSAKMERNRPQRSDDLFIGILIVLFGAFRDVFKSADDAMTDG
jgi:hypothetical protein